MNLKPVGSSFVDNDKSKAAMLVFVSLAIGLYLILTTVVVSRDGVAYINEIQRLKFDDLSSVRWYGFSAVIYGMHKFLTVFFQDSNQLWIYSGQIVSLIFKTASMVALFFLGKRLFGTGKSFFACFILLVLPYPAQFGSDFLRDWSGIFFISLSSFLLFEWVYKKKIVYLLLSIIVSGIGYFFRPEAAQVSIYAVILVMGYLVKTKSLLNNKRLILAFFSVLIFLSSLSIFLYSYKDGRCFPKKLKNIIERQTVSQTQPVGLNPSIKRLSLSFYGVISGVSENLNYYFLPFMLLGIWEFWRNSNKKTDDFYTKLFYCSFILLNIAMLVMLNYKWDYVSRRHCLPLAVISIYFIPYGILSFSRFLVKNVAGFKNLTMDLTAYIVAAIGIVICLAKLFIPLGYDKTHYLSASRWLADNTDSKAVVAASDSRIGFYSGRKFLVRPDSNIFHPKADYLVLPEKQVLQVPDNFIKTAEFNKKRKKILIYKKAEF